MIHIRINFGCGRIFERISMPEKQLTGKVSRERITNDRDTTGAGRRHRRLSRLGDAGGTVSDVMDELGIPGVVRRIGA